MASVGPNVDHGRGRALVLAIWLAAVLAGLALTQTDHRFRIGFGSLVSNLEAARADRLVAAHFGAGEHETLLYCVRGVPLSNPVGGERGFQLDDTCEADVPLAGDDPVRQVDAGFLSATPRTLLLQGIDLARSIGADEQPASQPPSGRSAGALARDLRRAELWSLVFTAVALLLCYRSLPIALLALTAGGAIVAVTVGLLTLLARYTAIPFIAVSVASLLALALGADLASLTALTGHGGRGRPHRSAIAGCGGVGLVFGVFALLPAAGLRAMGMVAIIAAAVAFVGSWTLIPALHGAIRRIAPARATSGRQRGLIGRFARGSSAHPLLALALAALLLAVPAVAGVGLLRDPGTTLPLEESVAPETVRAQLAVDTQRLLTGTVEFVVDAPRGPETEQAVQRLLAALQGERVFAAPVFVQWSADGAIGVVTAFAPKGDATDALAAARRAERAAGGVTIAIGGPVMRGAQVDAILRTWSLRAGLGAAALALLVAVAVFGAPVLAAVLWSCSLLAGFAGLGVLRRVIDHGWALGPFRLTAQPALDPWTPLLLISLVIAISTSYVALMLGQRRAGARDESHGAAFVRVMTESPQLTSAASLSMIAIGFGFTATGVPGVQQVGVGLALALGLEATVIRGVVAPALLRAAGVRRRPCRRIDPR